MLQVKEITKSYVTGDFKQVALNKVSLNFRQSEFVAILGQSGSGKTTLLNVVGGLDKYDSGDLIINGKSTKDFKASHWDAYRNNSVGFIFQSYNLITHLSIIDNVEMGMTLSGVSSSEKHKKAFEALERVGLKDHIHKKPNQLSGGQMQRVAIARALANNPDIILADEPTGALDSETSEQIMQLIKEIAKDKLVIMVTHNPDLADRYADRIVRFSDGKVQSDSNPFLEEGVDNGYKLKKTSMSFLTALKLSGKNILTKKWRTGLTAFASSIGIIGIALVLSLSNGFDKQISSAQNETLSGFPISISKKTIQMDMEKQREMMMGETDSEGEFPDEKVVYPYNASEKMISHTNKLSEEYTKYINDIDSNLLSGVAYSRLVNLNLLKSDGKTATAVKPSTISFTSYPFNTDSKGSEYLEKNYDLLSGKFPSEMGDIVMIVNEKNQLDTSMLEALGFDSKSKEISFDDIIGYEMKVVLNNDYYVKNGKYFTINGDAANLNNLYNSPNAVKLNIVGIIRPNENASVATLGQSLAYSDELDKFFINNAKDSEIVKAQKEVNYNILTGETFMAENNSIHGMPGMGFNGGATKEDVLSGLGADPTPTEIYLFPKDFTTKDEVLKYLDKWNDGKSDEDKVVYTDNAENFSNLMGGILDGITLVLVAFAAISLVVSLIMIGIITYISVLERTKEIGVLRALGARKKDVSRVFNAETFIIGTCSGLLGISIAYLLTFPINSVLYEMTDLTNVAQLNPVHAILLVVISVLLTMLGGLLPARMASKKDPVEALRTE